MPRKPSTIPENVRKFRPGPCTEIKMISGHYYVYSYHSIKLPSGSWGKKTDKCIGSIIPALSSLLDDLGRRTNRVVNYEKNLLVHSSSEVAIDGHAIRSCSDENDLGETGYKFCQLGEDQVNYLMGYDVNTGKPLFARMYRGSCNDKSTIEDLVDLLELNNILFVVDRGFYSSDNLKLLSLNGNSYIIPIPSHLKVFEESMAALKYTHYFYYVSGEKHARIQYFERKISDTERVLIFRDVDENEKCRFNYQRCIDQGKKGYTPEKLKENQEFFGVYVFQTNSTKSPSEIFTTYKKRWGIDTFYQYLKKRGDFNDLKFQDYYDEQGFAFIMLVTGQIHQEMMNKVRRLENRTTSSFDLLLKARALKLEKRGQYWQLKNARKKDLEILEKVGFKPQERFQV